MTVLVVLVVTVFITKEKEKSVFSLSLMNIEALANLESGGSGKGDKQEVALKVEVSSQENGCYIYETVTTTIDCTLGKSYCTPGTRVTKSTYRRC